MKQSRLMSWIETIVGTAIGFAIALATQLVVFPLFGFSPPLSQNLAITAIFTIVSIARGYLLRRLFEALHIRTPLSPGLIAIAAERRRQIDVEGWTAEHDAAYPAGDLARAGACYALTVDKRAASNGDAGLAVVPSYWPWASRWWKPKDDRRDLVRAGALIVAELDKIDRDRNTHRASLPAFLPRRAS